MDITNHKIDSYNTKGTVNNIGRQITIIYGKNMDIIKKEFKNQLQIHNDARIFPEFPKVAEMSIIFLMSSYRFCRVCIYIIDVA